MNKRLILPNLCRNSAVLVIVLLSQLSVIVAWLFLPFNNDGITTLGLASIYSLFVSLLGATLLCLSRAWIARQSFFFGVCVALVLMVISLLIVEFAMQTLIFTPAYEGYDYERIGRRALAALVAAAVLLRFFSLIELFNQHSKAEAEARVLALQSRIQPHFLFNSLNTISELAATDSEKAEAATTALASLFRASLENDRSFHSLEQEIKLCQRYLELERFRMGNKLKVAWAAGLEDAFRWQMPKLMLQPLLENAIVHGKNLSGEVLVKLDIRESNNYISIMIENELGEPPKDKLGHGIAIKNIQQRLETLYDDQFTFRSKVDASIYSVLLRIPKQPYNK